MVFSNAAGSVAVRGGIVQLRIHDGGCTEDAFADILDVIMETFAQTETPLKLILNSAGEEVASDHIAALVDLLSDRRLVATNLVGTAIILTGMQCTMASLAVSAMKFSKPIQVFSREQDAAEYIAGL
eukprot:jgi/Tetstr1/447351/TSEL_034788.t1